MRSDADRTTTALRLAISATFNKWVPFHGSATCELTEELAPLPPGGNPAYVTRASWLPIHNLAICFTHDESLDYNHVRATLNEWRRYSRFLTKDFYVLTPYYGQEDTKNWTVFAYHDRDADEGVVLAFRQETCEEPAHVVRLPFAKPGVAYRLFNEDSKETFVVDGGKLRSEGFTVTLGEPKSSAVFHIKANID
jgi:hypothetical protein